jgi:AcrR family transcriptional regulator
MHLVSQPVKPYSSKVRTEAAKRTRQLIREAATRLFVERGIAATTMRQIAEAAEVAERTVYTAFPTKTALFKATLDVATVGDEEPVAVAERPAFAVVTTERDRDTVVRLYVDYGMELLERAGDLLIAAEESSGADPTMREIVDEAAAAMTVNMRAVASAWQRNGLLRDGLDPDQAGDVLAALSGPQLHSLLRRRQGWTVEQYREWLIDTLLRTVLEG